MKVVICANTAWNLFNFRAGLIRSLAANGHEVVALAPFDRYVPHLTALGCRFVSIAMDSQGTNPGRDGLLLLRFWRVLRRERPNVYLSYTVKPNVYGSLAAQCLGIPVVNNISGLGTVFINTGWLTHFVRCLYRIALRRSFRVFFQNEDDRRAFVQNHLVLSTATELLPGSGIDLARFQFAQRVHGCSPTNKFRFLLIARMLRDKGIREFVEAANLIKDRWPNAECCLLGFLDIHNPTAISQSEMANWVAHGFVTYLGVRDDVRSEIATADCIVLPSYREGIPRSLLEASAVGRPIIATDAAGCREVVIDGYNGYLCKIKDSRDLATKMEWMMSLSENERDEMGRRGRAMMEDQFDERIVISKYLTTIDQIGW